MAKDYIIKVSYWDNKNFFVRSDVFDFRGTLEDLGNEISLNKSVKSTSDKHLKCKVQVYEVKEVTEDLKTLTPDKWVLYKKTKFSGDLIELSEFIKDVEDGGFRDFDGSGCWANATHYIENTLVKPSDFSPYANNELKIPLGVTHVLWFNE